MSERGRERESTPPSETWDVDAAARSLGAQISRINDVVAGSGHLLRFPEPESAMQSDLALFPERLTVRYRSPVLEITLSHVQAISVESDHLRIRSEDAVWRSDLVVSTAGGLLVSASPRNGSDEIQQNERSDSRVERATEIESPPATSTVPASEREQPRVYLVGRVGATPAFRTTPKGVLIAKFPLAVRESENKTTWHTVLAFGVRAVKLQESVKKGDAVEVIGYKHVREMTKKDGSNKMVEEVYAVVVKNR